jgi:hypothetical protein
MSVSWENERPLLLPEIRASRLVDGTAVGAGRFWPARGAGYAVWERVDAGCCWCWARRALARRRASSMRRTCSGVMGWLFAAARGGVVGRSVLAMVGAESGFGGVRCVGIVVCR